MESASRSSGHKFFLTRTDELTEAAKDFFYRHFKSEAGAETDMKDAPFTGFYNAAMEWEELLQAHISVPLTTFSPGMIAVLRGLWRGRNAVESEKVKDGAES